MNNAITPIEKLLMAQIWEKTRLSYFQEKGNGEKVIELTKKLKAIKKEIEDASWEKWLHRAFYREIKIINISQYN